MPGANQTEAHGLLETEVLKNHWSSTIDEIRPKLKFEYGQCRYLPPDQFSITQVSYLTHHALRDPPRSDVHV